MQIRVQTLPRLGDVTTAEAQSHPISAVLEVPNHFADADWQVCLWHSTDGNDWKGLGLAPAAEEEKPVDLELSPSLSRLHFRAELPFNRSIRFTIKFRHTLDQPWIWVNEEYGIEDGFVVLEDTKVASQKLEDLIPNLSSEWSVSTLRSQAPETSLWSLTTKIASCSADKSCSKDVEIGTPFTHFRKYVSSTKKTQYPKVLIRKTTGGLHWSDLVYHG